MIYIQFTSKMYNKIVVKILSVPIFYKLGSITKIIIF